MKWVLIWICAQCSDDLQRIYAAQTEERVRAVAVALKEDGGPGNYMVAKVNPGFEFEPVVIWDACERAAVVYSRDALLTYPKPRPKLIDTEQ